MNFCKKLGIEVCGPISVLTWKCLVVIKLGHCPHLYKAPFPAAWAAEEAASSSNYEDTFANLEEVQVEAGRPSVEH